MKSLHLICKFEFFKSVILGSSSRLQISMATVPVFILMLTVYNANSLASNTKLLISCNQNLKFVLKKDLRKVLHQNTGQL